MFSRKKPKSAEITLSGIPIKVTRKKVKNINLRVYPSKGEVRMSAPWHLRDELIQNFAASKLDWIKKKLANYQPAHRPPESEYKTGETHWYRGEEMELRVVFGNAAPKVICNKKEKVLELQVRPGSPRAKRKKVLKEWYRAELKKIIPKLIAKWEPVMGVQVNEFGVKQMKTRWGSCNIRDKRIWLNLELAKKSPACLEYVVVHEMVHLLERLHNDRFYRLMDQYLPGWQQTEKALQGKVD